MTIVVYEGADMKLTNSGLDPHTDARKEFKARLQVALALTLILERKLIQWGTALEKRSSLVETV
jgi:hypothetical protein